MKTKKHGWILQAATGRFVCANGGEVIDLSDAYVFDTRREARVGNYHIGSLDDDVVRKVKLNKKGKAVKIIPGR